MAGVIERYRPFLPVGVATPTLSLDEGSTPLIHANRLGAMLGTDRLFLKFEGANPTGSFKDRGMVVAVAKAIEQGARRLICASTGNTSASAAAYAAHADLACFVVLPLGGVATGKLNQALLYGATVLAIEGTFDDALRLVRAAADEPGTQLVNSINPYRIEGQKTAAFEIIDVLDDAPDILAIPVGNAGNITAYWRGFREYREAGRCGRLPEMWGFQAAGAAPLALNAPVPKPETVASAIRIGAPARAQEARAAVRESRGCFGAVADDQILEAYRLIASTEGILCEPASAAPIAGLLQHVRDGHTLTGRTIVAVLTGNGLKDPDVAEAQAPSITIMPPDAASLQQAMRLDA